jgi:GNAT superfamily N-acetyltransferase
MGAKGLTYRQEFLAEAYDEAQQLLEMHWQEIALNKDAIKLNPDLAQYEEAEKAGCLRIFTARDDGRLVGYFALLVQRSLHYQDHAFANNDVIFLHPDYRKGHAASKLIKFAVECLAHDGVSMVFINTKTHRPFDVLLKRLGFNHIENVYAKRLI